MLRYSIRERQRKPFHFHRAQFANLLKYLDVPLSDIVQSLPSDSSSRPRTTIRIRSSSRNDGSTGTSLCTDWQMTCRKPCKPGVLWCVLKAPICQLSATADLVLQSRTVRAKFGWIEV